MGPQHAARQRVAGAPGHAVQYGTSLRVAAERDVFVEGIKDAAIGMYERDVAMRTRDRLAGNCRISTR